MSDLISIGKILNFHGIMGEAKVGYSNASQIQSAKKVFLPINGEKKEFNIEKVRFHKTFAIVKFTELNNIDELLPFKGVNIYLEKQSVEENLEKEEYLIEDLIGLNVFDDKDDLVGIVQSVGTNSGNDILCVKPQNPDFEQFLIPFVKELVPIVDIKGKKIIIKPIEGLLS